MLYVGYSNLENGDTTIQRPMQRDSVAKKEHRVNDEITSSKLQVIDENGNNLGVLSRLGALQAAGVAGLDLVEIASEACPPVCKIVNYGKLKYTRQKRKSEARKKQKTIDIKEIKFRPNIDTHDYQVKLRSIRKFLQDGNKVKVTLRFRGREMAHEELGEQMLQRVQEDSADLANIEQSPKSEGRQMVMLLSPI